MPLGLVLLSLDGKSLPEAIICNLSEGLPLSARQLYHALSQQTNREFTYQAVHKAVSSLSKKNIISKKDNKYLLSEKFILRLAQYCDLLILKYRLVKEKNKGDEDRFHPLVLELFDEIKKQNQLLERTLGLPSTKEFLP